MGLDAAVIVRNLVVAATLGLAALATLAVTDYRPPGVQPESTGSAG